MSHAYSIYETKARFSEILRMVKAGKEVIVNERGHSIARILPFKKPDNLQEHWDWLCSSGQILKTNIAKKDFSPQKQAKGALERFLKERE
ncbi:MAG: type II toxin-antitoxin system prevent-host-death family antitoxin [Myxococcaceae bacterium]